MLLPREMALYFDGEYKRWVEEYSKDRQLLSANFGLAFKRVTELGLRKTTPSSGALSFEEGSKMVETLKFTSGDGEQVLSAKITSEYGGDFVAMFRGLESCQLTVSPEMGQLVKGVLTELTVTYKGGGASNLRLLVETEQEDFQFVVAVEADKA